MSGVIAGLVISVGTTTASFIQAGQQRKLAAKAEREADLAMERARKELTKNTLAALDIDREPYELEREALLSAGAQAVEAGQESERGAAATAGRVFAAQQRGQAGIRSAMSKELTALEKAAAEEEGRLRDIGVQLDLGEVAGAQQAMRDAQNNQAAAVQQGIAGVGQIASGVAQLAPTYGKSEGVREFDKGQRKAVREDKKTFIEDFRTANPDDGFLGIGTGARKAYRADDAANQRVQGVKQDFLQGRIADLTLSETELGDFVAAGIQKKENAEGKMEDVLIGAEKIDVKEIKNMDRDTFKNYMDSLSPGQRTILLEKLNLVEPADPMDGFMGIQG